MPLPDVVPYAEMGSSKVIWHWPLVKSILPYGSADRVVVRASAPFKNGQTSIDALLSLFLFLALIEVDIFLPAAKHAGLRHLELPYSV